MQNSKLDGVKFRRQQPISDYIVDFASTSSKLIIELDGGQHNEPKNISQDKNRDEYLVQQGFTVIRIWNNEVYNNIEGVVDYIRNIISNPTRKSQIFTLPQGEGLEFILFCLVQNVSCCVCQRFYCTIVEYYRENVTHICSIVSYDTRTNC